MRRIILYATLLLLAGIAAWMFSLATPWLGGMARADEEVDGGWISLFDGERLTDWEASELANNWTVEEGCIVGRGSRSHLFYKGQEFENFEFKAEVKLNHEGNSGMYFRTGFGPGWPKGYEAQVNNTSPDPKRTGSLYNFVSVGEQRIEDDTWWTQHIIAEGNHIIVKVNDEVVVDYVDDENTYTKGYVALQQHNLGSEVRYRNLMVKPLP
jgi:hypothetical protein